MTRKLIVIAGLSIAVITGVGAIRPAAPPGGEYKNLQVLPKNISARQLNKIMVDEFEDELGVSCSFCHSENKETHRPDYASDEKPEKQIARAMMRMTIGINKKYFEIKHPMPGDSTLVVTCGTCHNGKPHPGNDSTP
ncbi:MAG TPA: c-type cytochrome [Chitinophagaceae bacterium]|nr:c-type cytochrome [Chitinophagaceae bacterium]